MKKSEMAYMIKECPLYEGDFTFEDLMKLSKIELQDMYDQMLLEEQEYYEY